MASFLRRLVHLFRRSRHDADLREEMETHRSLRQEKLEREGVASPDAARASRRAFGNATLAREDAREEWTWRVLASLAQDTRHAVRALAKRPLLSLSAIVTLALAIGANVAIFSLIDRVVLRPLDAPDAEQLMIIEGTFESRGVTTRRTSMNWASAERVRGMSMLPNAVIASVPSDRATQGMVVSIPGAEPLRDVRGAFVTANYFQVLGLQPFDGRDFGADDETAAASPVVMLSYNFWRSRFGGAADTIGRTVDINGSTAVIIGVAPRTFTGTDLGQTPPDLYLPLMTASRLATDTGVQTDGRNGFSFGIGPGAQRSPVSPVAGFAVLARVTPGAEGQVQAELSALGGSGRWEVRGLADTMVPFGGRAELRRFLALLAGAVGLTLLIGCANLASLLLARSEERRAELAVRAALGAGRRRLVQAMAVEAGLLAVAGGAAALVVANWIDRGLSAFVLPGGVALSSLRDGTDARVLFFAMFAVAVAAILIGIAPAARAGRRDLALDARRHGGGTLRLGISRSLLALQMAVCIVLVFFAALFVRSMSNALGTDLGFDRSNLLSVSFKVPQGRMFDAVASTALAERVRQVPGVAAATVGPLPISKGSDVRRNDVAIDGRILELSIPMDTVYASAEYLTTLRLPVLRGRGFNAQDRVGAPPVALVNEAAAHQFWPDDEPLGRRISLPLPPMMRGKGVTPPDFSVVGIVRDVKVRSIKETGQPILYLPRNQHEFYLAGVAASGGAYLVIRTDGEVEGIAGLLAAVAQDSGLSLQSVTALDESIIALLMPQRFGRTLLSVLGAIALALTVIGVYGLISCVVARSTKETGIRMALGASTRQIVGALLRRAFLPVLAGAAIGSAAAWFGGRFVDSFMYGIGGSDPGTLVVAVVAILAVGLVAALLPTRKALRISPVETLRAD